ncbi:MAG: hypothetical protein ACAI25_19115 [Planctomycetota bacterium]
MNRWLLVALLIGVLFPGCILGRVRDQVPLDPDKVARIIPGQTTKKDVVDLLGAPTYVNDRIGLRVLGKPVQVQGAGPLIDELVHSPLDHSYTYEYTDTKSLALYLLIVSFTNQETKRDRVVVFFDQKGLVSHVGATFDAKNVEFRMPTSD